MPKLHDTPDTLHGPETRGAPESFRRRLSCDDAGPLVEDYLDAALTPVDAAAFEGHLERCPACAEELALGRRILDELHELPAVSPRPAVTAAVLRHAETHPSLASRLRCWLRPWRMPRHVWQPALAMVLVAAVAAGTYYERSRQPQYTEAEIAQAADDLKLALAYIGRISREAGTTVGTEVIGKRVVAPIGASISNAVLPPFGLGGTGLGDTKEDGHEG